MKTKDIISLIGKNSDLPILAYVNGEVVGDPDACCSWLGRITGAKVVHVAEVEPFGYYDQSIVLLEDYDDYYEYLINSEEYENLTDTEADLKALETIHNLDFKKVIILNIGTY